MSSNFKFKFWAKIWAQIPSLNYELNFLAQIWAQICSSIFELNFRAQIWAKFFTSFFSSKFLAQNLISKIELKFKLKYSISNWEKICLNLAQISGLYLELKWRKNGSHFELKICNWNFNLTFLLKFQAKIFSTNFEEKNLPKFLTHQIILKFEEEILSSFCYTNFKQFLLTQTYLISTWLNNLLILWFQLIQAKKNWHNKNFSKTIFCIKNWQKI